MGLGIGINCERCGNQLSYDYYPFKTKEDGHKHNICGNCVKEIHKKEFDKKAEEEE